MNDAIQVLPRPQTVRVGVISLGCAKNLVDTEVMLGHLDRAGATFVQDPAEADVILVNTCSFIGPAREESIQTILETAELKKTGRLKRLVVAGCMVQRYAEELRESMPEVDAFIGLDELHKVVASAGIVDTAARPKPMAQQVPLVGDLPVLHARPRMDNDPASNPHTAGPTATAAWGQASFLYDHTTPRRLATQPWTAYVKIAEGCNHTCSFCAIPSFRGLFRSRPIDDICREAESLAAGGVREINLIAQDSSHYGRDRGRNEGLADLLAALNEIEALRWIRVHYLYPNTVTERLIETMATSAKVLNYVDMPLQHAHPATLKRMRRGGSTESHLRLLARFRHAMPDAALRSTFIVGFPGETEEEFQTLLDFLDEAQFQHAGVFTYSHEERTTAFDLQDDVTEEIKQERKRRFLERQQEIAFRHLSRDVGKRFEVLIEGTHPDTDLLLTGRTTGQAQDVDGQILINDGVADPGQFVSVEITETAGYDLVGSIVDRA